MAKAGAGFARQWKENVLYFVYPTFFLKKNSQYFEFAGAPSTTPGAAGRISLQTPPPATWGRTASTYSTGIWEFTLCSNWSFFEIYWQDLPPPALGRRPRPVGISLLCKLARLEGGAVLCHTHGGGVRNSNIFKLLHLYLWDLQSLRARFEERRGEAGRDSGNFVQHHLFADGKVGVQGERVEIRRGADELTRISHSWYIFSILKLPRLEKKDAFFNAGTKRLDYLVRRSRI